MTATSLVLRRVLQWLTVGLMMYGLFGALGSEFPTLTEKQRVLILFVVGVVWVRPGFDETSEK